MSKPDSPGQDRLDESAAVPAAGVKLRQAREAQGLHIAALAAAIKVTPRKLEALESGRLQELPDATFARALAQTVCRHLKIDPKPVLALLPAHGVVSLEPSTRIQSTPYRDRGSRSDHGNSARSLGPWFWGAAVLLFAAAAVVLVPGDWWEDSRPAPAVAAPPNPAALVAPTSPLAAPAELPTSPASAGASSLAPASGISLEPVTPVTTVKAAGVLANVGSVAPAESLRDRQSATETVFSAPPATAGALPAVGGVLVVTTTEASWVEVRDANGRSLLNETVQPGRTVGLDGPLPLRLLVGNASATQLVFMGRPVDLAARSRENVARFELQ